MPDNVVTDVAVLRTEVDQLKMVMIRMDEAIAKMNVISTDTSRLLAVHANKFHNQDQLTDSLKDMVQKHERELNAKTADLQKQIENTNKIITESHTQQHKEIMAAINNLDRKMVAEYEKLSTRVTKLENWKWWVMGAAAAIGFIIARTPIIERFFG